MITTDSVVFAACIKLRLPCLYTGCRLQVLDGHATFYEYTPGVIDYLQKLISMINHHINTVLINNEITKAYLKEIYEDPNKCKFIIDDPTSRIKQKPGQPIKKGKIIQGLKFHPYDRRVNVSTAQGILEQNRKKIKELIDYIITQNKNAIRIHQVTIAALNSGTNFDDLNINITLYTVTANAFGIATAAAAGNAGAIATLPAAAAAANDLINQIYSSFERRMQRYKIKHVITRVNDDNYVLVPNNKLYIRIISDMNITPETTDLDVIIQDVQNSVRASAALRGVEYRPRKSAVAAAATAAVAAASSSLFHIPLNAASASSASAAYTAPFAYTNAASAAPFAYTAANAAMPSSKGGATNIENDYKELIQSINKEIENKDSELITNLFLCYAFQLLITMQDVMEYGLSKSDELFELAIKSTNPKDISSLNELVVYNEFINSIHYYSIKDKKNSNASLYFGSYLLALDNEVYHYEFAIIYDNLISKIDSDTVLNKYQIGEICGTNDNNILKYGKILKKYINFIDDNSDMMKNIEKSVEQMIKNTIDITKTPTTGSTKKPTTASTKKPTTGSTKKSITGSTKKSITGSTKKSITGSTKKSITGSTKSIHHKLKRSLSRDRRHKISVGGTRKKIDTRKCQRKHKRHSRKHSHAAIRTSKARPAPRRFR
jgi:hypothetical protein